MSIESPQLPSHSRGFRLGIWTESHLQLHHSLAQLLHLRHQLFIYCRLLHTCSAAGINYLCQEGPSIDRVDKGECCMPSTLLSTEESHLQMSSAQADHQHPFGMAKHSLQLSPVVLAGLDLLPKATTAKAAPCNGPPGCWPCVSNCTTRSLSSTISSRVSSSTRVLPWFCWTCS